MKFAIYHTYSNDGRKKQPRYHSVALRRLLKLRGQVMARAEFSGCEGCYVEVAAWNYHKNVWQRYAFEKFFGGELWRDLDARQTCERLAEIINTRNRNKTVSFIHNLESYTGNRKALA